VPISCPVNFDVKSLRSEVQSMYSRVAEMPQGEFHFHRGPAYAAGMLGYDAAELSRLPATVTSSFAGVANPHAIAPLPDGATVVDIGCGAGTDLLLAAMHVGPSGRAIGVDMTEAMRSRVTEGAMHAGLKNVQSRAGDATSWPIDHASVDMVISSALLSVDPDKERAIAEIARILKPGGRIQIGDIIIGTELDEEALADIDLWTG